MLQKIRTISGVLLAILILSVGIAVAQEQPQATTNAPEVQKRNRGDRVARRNKRGQERRRRGFGLRGLDLSDQQKEQARAIMRANFEANKAQFQELAQLRRKGRDGTLSEAEQARAKELRAQLRESRKNARTQMAGMLTPEQRLKLEERQKNREEHRRRGGRRKQLNQPT